MSFLKDKISQHTDLIEEEIDSNSPLQSFGLGSLDFVEISTELGSSVGKQISPTIIFSYPTLHELAEHHTSSDTSSASTTKQVTSIPKSVRPIKDKDSRIAVIGMSCRYPGSCHSFSQFWHFLQTNEDGVLPVRPDRWDIDTYLSETRNTHEKDKMISPCVGSYDEMDMFDPKFFNISANEARRIDPQQRLMLELAGKRLKMQVFHHPQ